MNVKTARQRFKVDPGPPEPDVLHCLRDFAIEYETACGVAVDPLLVLDWGEFQRPPYHTHRCRACWEQLVKDMHIHHPENFMVRKHLWPALEKP